MGLRDLAAREPHLSGERFEVLEPTLRAVTPSFRAACERVVVLGALEVAGGPVVPYWVVRDSETGSAYVVTVEKAREILAAPEQPTSRRSDPHPLVEETSDPSELPTVSEWLRHGGTLREVPPPEKEAPGGD